VATDDQQIFVAGQAPTPAHFNISGTGQIRPKTIFATFDGTAAGSAFLPAVKIISDGGQTVGIFPTDTSVAAGASADVTWFHGVKAAGGGTVTGSSVISGFASRAHALTFAPGTHVLSFDTFRSNDASITKGAGALFTTIDLAAGGQFRVDVSMSWASNTGAPYVGQVQLLPDPAGGFGTFFGLTGPPVDITQVYSTDVGDSFMSNGTSTWHTGAGSGAPPYAFNLTLENDQALFTDFYSMIVQIENPTPLS
jgi:hypothetical protein